MYPWIDLSTVSVCPCWSISWTAHGLFMKTASERATTSAAGGNQKQPDFNVRAWHDTGMGRPRTVSISWRSVAMRRPSSPTRSHPVPLPRSRCTCPRSKSNVMAWWKKAKSPASFLPSLHGIGCLDGVEFSQHLIAHPHLLVRAASERWVPTLVGCCNRWLSLAKPTLKVIAFFLARNWLLKRCWVLTKHLVAHPHLLVRATSERWVPTLVGCNRWLLLAKPALKVLVSFLAWNWLLRQCWGFTTCSRPPTHIGACYHWIVSTNTSYNQWLSLAKSTLKMLASFLARNSLLRWCWVFTTPNSPPTLTGAGHQWTVRTNNGCN